MKHNYINIREKLPCKDNILLYWLGGAGFLFVFDNGQIVCIDPYLSDSVERIAGFRRLSIPPFCSGELSFDILLLTHDHPDHLDIDSFDDLMDINPNCQIIASSSCELFLKEKRTDYNISQAGMNIQIGGINIQTVSADHGELCPDAVGFIVSYGSRNVYCTGDTSGRYDRIKDAIALKPEVLITCINGAYGNLDEKQAAILAKKCESKIVIPCHFWLFAEHGGDPGKFKSCLESESPKSKLLLLMPGRAKEI